jgi:NOL1/NOP2/sun family putative RNA methylase
MMPHSFIPTEFQEKYSKLLGEEASDFFACCKKKLPRTIRVNTLKITPEKLVALLEKRKIVLEQHSFLENVFFVKTSNVHFSDLPEHKQGYFVSQDISSMMPVLALAPKKNSLVCDLTAAPGTKTSLIAEKMQNTGAVVAVDINKERLKGLRFNINRLGIINTLVVQQDAKFFVSRNLFDFVLLDAPCSSEGLVRKRFDALRGWSQKLVDSKAQLQKQLIQKAFSLLKPNCALVYSTCTLAPEENEAVVDFLLKKNSSAIVEKIDLGKFKARAGLQEYLGKSFSEQTKNCARVLPQDNDSEAFFVAKIKKVAE